MNIFPYIRAGISILLTATTISTAAAQKPSDYVDPRIGSEGLGRVFIGPSAPFGMVKPSPDCTTASNSGWLPLPAPVNGFGQVHVSGTGGGPKYGNILVTPFCSGMDRTEHTDFRTTEDIRLGYYATTFARSGILTEITTAARAAHYRFTFPTDSLRSLAVDAGFFLGEQPVPDAREAQQLVGSEVQVVADRALMGYSRIRGGWNNGRAYTVYFYAETDTPFATFRTWKDGVLSSADAQFDSGQKTGVNVRFGGTGRKVQLRVGISFVSALKARENALQAIPEWDFEATRQRTVDQWDALLGRISVPADTPAAQQRMLYTGLYHTMLMPVDRTGECPLWNDPDPYYDDYYAIWDTYRTSAPLLTLLDPQREADLIRSLLIIYKRDGYMPDARSGNANGRTQGGSNAEIMIADAFAKGLEGIDYELALEAMLKDATVAPGGNEEAEGRGGLTEYLRLGYVPFGIPRAGNRTVEYAFCDYAIACVARGLGRDSLAREYLRRSDSWRNLWRSDYTHDGARGFILPRNAEGEWLDELPYGHSAVQRDTYRYTPVTMEGPWYTPWWSTFFYEATSWEYSLSIPHDVPGLIAQCGGEAAFETRLDRFFDRGYYNVNNEPSFLTPCLYHWINRPDCTSDRVLDILARHYNDTPLGLPGNDDSGAMSSWLVFHMMGLFPNAGTDYYLLHTPLLRETTLHLANGRTFTLQTEGLSAKNRYIQQATLNGKPFPYSSLTHAELMEGGVLRLKMGSKPQRFAMHPEDEGTDGTSNVLNAEDCRDARSCFRSNNASETTDISGKWGTRTLRTDTLTMVFRLHGQTRRYTLSPHLEADTLYLDWGIERNLRWQSGRFVLPKETRLHARRFRYPQPIDGDTVVLEEGTFALLSTDALKELHTAGSCTYNGTVFRLLSEETTADGRRVLHALDEQEGARLTVLDDEELPLILRMERNPLEIDWEIR